MARGSRGRRKKDFAEALEREIDRETAVEAARLSAKGGLHDFQAFEIAARQASARSMRRAIVHTLNADRSDNRGPRQPCRCGGEARFVGRRRKTSTSILGPLNLERAWHRCGRCRSGFSPRDRELGLEGATLSPALLHMIGIAAAKDGFEDSSTLPGELAGLSVAPKTVERHAKALGREIADDEAQVVEPEPGDARTLHLGLDGTGMPAHASEVAGRKGKRPDGSAGTREAKLAVVWSAEGPATDGRPARDPGSAACNAAIETVATRDTDREPAPFARRVLREAERRGFDKAERQVILGDGAAWIWNLADERFPDAI